MVSRRGSVRGHSSSRTLQRWRQGRRERAGDDGGVRTCGVQASRGDRRGSRACSVAPSASSAGLPAGVVDAKEIRDRSTSTMPSCFPLLI